MKILIITQTCNTQSGIGRYSKGVYENLRTLNATVSVMSKEGDTKLFLRKDGISFIKNCFAARKAARTFDIIHALDAWPYGIYALFAVLGTRKKLFLGGVGTYSIPPHNFSLKRILFLALYKKVSGVFCISVYVKQRIAERLPFKVSLRVVHLAADLLPKPQGNPYTQFSLPNVPGPVFITVGAVKERKGQLDTVKGLIKLKNRYPNFIYIIVGSLADTVYVKKIRMFVKQNGVSDKVIFIDSAKSDADLSLLYSIADIHLLNSNNQADHFEGFGLVFLEANQFGVPGIGSRNCGIEDAIKDGVSGLLIPQKDHVGIARAVETILSEKKRFEKGARSWYNQFDWKKTVETYLNFYKTL